MINDLLDFTGAGLAVTKPISPSGMDLQSLCTEVVDEMRTAHPACALKFESTGELTGPLGRGAASWATPCSTARRNAAWT